VSDGICSVIYVRINGNYFPKHKYLIRLCKDMKCLLEGMNVSKFRPLKGIFLLSIYHITYTRHLYDDRSADKDIKHQYVNRT
jgi:hypothetical protein